jgi:6-phosphogluconolactonase
MAGASPVIETAAEVLDGVEPVDDVPAAFGAILEERFANRRGQRFVLFLSGGLTAAACYDWAARQSQLDWSLVDIYMGDERLVAADDRAANQRLVREHLVGRVGNVGSFTPMPTEGDPDACAAEYDAVLRELVHGPGIDFIHLGLGPDGHTASLFPDASSLEVTDAFSLVTQDPSGRNPHPRLTVTYPVIDSARVAVFTVAGREKHAAIVRLQDGDDLPAGRVAAHEIRWLVDVAAFYGQEAA